MTKLMDYVNWKPDPSSAPAIVPVRHSTPPGVVPEQLPMKLQAQVQKYQVWLHMQAKRKEPVQERQDYTKLAKPPVLLNGQAMTTYAPYRPTHSAYQTFTTPQFLTFALLVMVAMLLEFFFGYEFLTGCIGVITALYVTQLIITAILLGKASQMTVVEQISSEIITALDKRNVTWPLYTILCPLYKEAAIVPQFLIAMSKLDYPKDRLQILLLVEESDKQTQRAIQQLAPPPHFQLVIVPDGQPRTKPRACNYGLMQATGQYVVIYDAEDIPDPLQLKKAVLTFANHGSKLACVQAQLNFYNASQNLLTRLFTIEYTMWFDIMLPSLWRGKLSLPLGGTSNHFQTTILRGLGGWDAFNVTEDCDLGMRLTQYNLETAIVESTTYEEANSQFGNWIRQRSRWIKGYMQTYLVYMRNPREMFTRKKIKTFFSLQLVIGTASCVFFLNPVMWLLTLIYILDRAQVDTLYHTLFPGPVLYTGMICLIFGNFFYLYTAMIACMRRQQYSLVPFCFLLPIYWLMMSVAALKSFWQLFTRPHYWEKTRHGFHLKSKRVEEIIDKIEAKQPIDTLLTARVPSVSLQQHTGTITERMKAIVTLPIAVIQGKPVNKTVGVRGFYLPLTILVASITSIATTIYYYNHHIILLNADSYGHLKIARQVIDSLNPGIAQLGAVWLPLPHILMIPFIWNGFLWRTGLAGSIPAMCCYILSAFFLYKSIAKVTKGQNVLAFLGTCLFLFNPDILYLQATPMTELVCCACLLASCYGFLVWLETSNISSLVGTAIACFFATITRYDGWALFIILVVATFIVCLLKRWKIKRTISTLLIFCPLAGLGIILWLVWSQMIFGNALYFKQGIYSSQAQQLPYIQRHIDVAYHSLSQAFIVYGLDVWDNVGPVICCLGVVALLIAFIPRHKEIAKGLINTIGLCVFLSPFPFYMVSLLLGQAIIFVPHLLGNSPYQFYNVRYGAQMVTPMALLTAWAISDVVRIFHKRRQLISMVLLLVTLLAQQIWAIEQHQPMSVAEGLHGTSCVSLSDSTIFMVEHYTSGYILADTTHTSVQMIIPLLGRSIRNTLISEGNGAIWQAARKNPKSYVEWVIVNRTRNDAVPITLDIHDPSFISSFALVFSGTDGQQIFHKIGVPIIAHNPPSYLADYQNTTCV